MHNKRSRKSVANGFRLCMNTTPYHLYRYSKFFLSFTF